MILPGSGLPLLTRESTPPPHGWPRNASCRAIGEDYVGARKLPRPGDGPHGETIIVAGGKLQAEDRFPAACCTPRSADVAGRADQRPPHARVAEALEASPHVRRRA